MNKEVLFGPAGLGPTKSAIATLEAFHAQGLRACELAFTHGAYIKSETDARTIQKRAAELGIELSIHAPYYVNLNSDDPVKRAATKQRILECCKVGEWLGAKVVVFHPGYYREGVDRIQAYTVVKEGIIDIMKELKKNKWVIQIAPETMGKINVFGSIDEISRLAQETGCAVCIDFAHILARDKKVDYALILKAFPQEEWHVHFSGIVYGEKGEKHHIKTGVKEWKALLAHLPRDKKIRIINESPDMVADAVVGMKLWGKL
ncbi:endonuclease IV [Candidatus Pacearchaeota archaeon]|nr:endonuclease IV [Candidatus Pacearchaeota archaeon]